MQPSWKTRMRKSRFTEAQIIGVLKQAEGGTKLAHGPDC